MNSALDILWLRRPTLRYVSPGVCEASFSGSGAPIIVLDALARGLGPTGLVLGGSGNFRLSWNNYPGALCFSVYKAVDELQPFGAYVLIAECITDNFIDLDSFGPGVYRVTAITEEGESDPSDPIVVEGAGSVVVSVMANPFATSTDLTAEPGIFIITKEGFHNTDLVVNFVISGTAEPGVDYHAISGSAIILSGQDSVEVIVTPISNIEDPEVAETIILTLATGGFYTIGVPNEATVTIEPVICGPPAVDCWTVVTDPLNNLIKDCVGTPDGELIRHGYATGGEFDGTLSYCGGPSGCTKTFVFRAQTFGGTGDDTRNPIVLVDGVPMSISFISETESQPQTWCGVLVAIIPPNECIDIQVLVEPSTNGGVSEWNLWTGEFVPDGCAATVCGTPSNCNTVIQAGDEFVLCGSTFGGGENVIAAGNTAAAEGIIRICGGSEGCTFELEFRVNGNVAPGPPINGRAVQFSVDDGPVTMNVISDDSLNGTAIVSPGVNSCILVYYNLGSWTEGNWSIRANV